MKFIEKMKSGKLNLVVSCPVNDYDFVKAAWEHGADAVKIHLNVHHHASGTDFKSMKEELDFVQRIFKDSPVPVGVVVGGSPEIVRQDFANVLAQPFDFLSLYLHDAVGEVLNQSKITKMFACNHTYSMDEIRTFEALGAEVLEVSIVDPDLYGTPLTMRDLLKYKMINDAVSIPTLLPTQKKIIPSDVALLHEVGFNAIMVGAVVTGKDITTFGANIQAFRDAIDAL